MKILSIEPKEIISGFRARFIHSQHVTLAFWDIDEGAVLPEHSHFHEQISHVLEGQFELQIDGQTHIYVEGSIVVIPSHAVHGGRALTPCRIMDVFSPVREDYR